jgi:PTS system mannose-specific IIA component
LIGKERRNSSTIRPILEAFIEMVGAVVLTHSFVARELIAMAEYLLGKMAGIVAVSLDGRSNAIQARKIISEAIQSVDEGEGVLILADLFGGSPSNLAFSLLDQAKIEVITGVNLSMVLTFWKYRKGRDLVELSACVKLSGRRNILVARTLKEEWIISPRNQTDGKPVLGKKRKES